MLKIMNSVSESPAQIDIGSYIPLVITWTTNTNLEPQPLYGCTWSIGEKYSLLEIRLNLRTNTFELLKLVLAGKATIFSSNKHITTSTKLYKGFPVFDTNFCSYEQYTREEKDFEVHLGQNHVLLLFSQAEIESQFMSENIKFGFDRTKSLCAIEVINLEKSQMEQLQKSLEFQCGH